MSVTTPADLTITPRDLKVDRNTRNARWWHGGDPIATAYFNALSAAFPQGETFFIESVRRYRDQVDEPLREQIAAFVQQEAMHTREHDDELEPSGRCCYAKRPWQCLYFLPDPHGQTSLRPTLPQLVGSRGLRSAPPPLPFPLPAKAGCSGAFA